MTAQSRARRCKITAAVSCFTFLLAGCDDSKQTAHLLAEIEGQQSGQSRRSVCVSEHTCRAEGFIFDMCAASPSLDAWTHHMLFLGTPIKRAYIGRLWKIAPGCVHLSLARRFAARPAMFDTSEPLVAGPEPRFRSDKRMQNK